LVHGKKAQWFDSRNIIFFTPDGVSCQCKVCNAINVHRTFKEVDLHARSLFERRGNQNDDTGEDDKGNMPLYMNLSFGGFSLSRNVQVVWRVLRRVGREI